MKWLKSVNVIIFFNYVVVASSAASAEDIVFGYSTDSPPISYTGVHETPEGFCSYLFEFLNDKHKNPEYNKIIPLKIESTSGRFRNFAKQLEPGQIGIQCGPTSKTLDRETDDLDVVVAGRRFYGEFSEPFFIAGARVLVKKDKVYDLYARPDSIKIGTLENVTTNSAIRSFFPLQNFIIINNRGGVKKALGDDNNDGVSVDAFAGDDILLLDILANDLEKDDYVIEPSLSGYSKEKYAIVIYYTNRPNDYGHSKLKQRIDKWISHNGSYSEIMNRSLDERNIDINNPFLMSNSLVDSLRIKELSLNKDPSLVKEFSLNPNVKDLDIISSRLLKLADPNVDDESTLRALKATDVALQENDIMTNLLLNLSIANRWSVTRVIFYIAFILALLGLYFLLWYFLKRKLDFQSLKKIEIPNQKVILQKAGDDLHNKALPFLGRSINNLDDMESILKRNLSVVPESLSEARKNIGEAISQVRNISYMLNQRIINDRAKEIEAILSEYRNKFHIAGEINIKSASLVDEVIEITCDILYNCLENISKHANIDRAFVNINIQNDQGYEFLSIEVRDTGDGFDSQSGYLGVGLSSIKTKVESIGGKMRIRSRPNQGTTIEASIPLKKRRS